MPESLIVVNTKNAHTWNRTIGANSIEDEYVLQGEQPLPSYTIQASTISIATANDHVLEIMAGASLNVRIRSILIEQVVNATAAALVSFALFRR